MVAYQNGPSALRHGNHQVTGRYASGFVTITYSYSMLLFDITPRHPLCACNPFDLHFVASGSKGKAVM